MVTRWDDLPFTISVKEAAAIAGIGRDSMYEWAHSDGFPAFKRGRSIRIVRDKFRALLEDEAAKGLSAGSVSRTS